MAHKLSFNEQQIVIISDDFYSELIADQISENIPIHKNKKLFQRMLDFGFITYNHKWNSGNYKSSTIIYRLKTAMNHPVNVRNTWDMEINEGLIPTEKEINLI